MQQEDYTTNQAARVLEVSASAVRKMIAGGALMAHKDGQGRYRIPREAVRAKLEGEEGFSSQAEFTAASEDADQTLAKLREEVAAARREIRLVWEEFRAMREEELRPLAHGVQSAEDSRKALVEERQRLRAELERERGRADRLKAELEEFHLKWWTRWQENEPPR